MTSRFEHWELFASDFLVLLLLLRPCSVMKILLGIQEKTGELFHMISWELRRVWNLPCLHSNKLVCHRFMDVGRGHMIPGPETKGSSSITAMEITSISASISAPWACLHRVMQSEPEVDTWAEGTWIFHNGKQACLSFTLEADFYLYYTEQ